MDKKVTRNCLSLVRLLAALQVMFIHIIQHLSIEISEHIKNAIYYFRGVPIFFVISGLVIWFSIERSPTLYIYLKKRFLRIYPELLVCIIIEIATIAIFYNDLNFKSLTLFFISQATIFQFWTPESLRGYGCGVPNGSLWVICIFIQFYIIVWFLYRILYKKSLKLWLIIFALLSFISILFQVVFEITNSEIMLKLYDITIIRYLWLFYLGCLMANFFDILLPIIKKFWILFLVSGFIFYKTQFDVYAGYYIFWSVFMVIGVIGFAYHFYCINIKVDVSYGLFIYHMIIVNIFVQLSLNGSMSYLFWVLILSCICAIISTFTVGKWALQKNRNLS